MMIASNIYKGLLWVALITILLLSLLPLSSPMLELFSWQDKVHHFVAHGALCFLAIRSYGDSHSIWTIGFSLVAFGLGLEIAQSITGYRFGDPLDVVANSLGIVIVATMHLVQQRNP